MVGMLDEMMNKNKAAPVGDPKTAMVRLQEIFRSQEYKSAAYKKRARPYDAPATTLELTKAEADALAEAEHEYNIASVIPGKPREDVRWDGIPVTPTLPPETGPHALSFTLDIAREPDPFVRRELARQARNEIMHKKSIFSNAYYHGDDPDHKTVVANVAELIRIENEK
jgi:hypothetical protein